MKGTPLEGFRFQAPIWKNFQLRLIRIRGLLHNYINSTYRVSCFWESGQRCYYKTMKLQFFTAIVGLVACACESTNLPSKIISDSTIESVRGAGDWEYAKEPKSRDTRIPGIPQ